VVLVGSGKALALAVERQERRGGTRAEVAPAARRGGWRGVIVSPLAA